MAIDSRKRAESAAESEILPRPRAPLLSVHNPPAGEQASQLLARSANVADDSAAFCERLRDPGYLQHVHFADEFTGESSMPFATDEFFVGMIAYFTVNSLRRHPRIRNSDAHRDNKGEPRPFVCYAAAGGEAYWTCLTGTDKTHRSKIDRQWLRKPSGRFMLSCAGDLIISDASNTFVGPVEAFAQASHKHDRCKGMLRPMLVREGVEHVQRIVRACGGWMPSIDDDRIQRAA